MLGYAHNKCNLKYKFKKDIVNDDYLINVLHTIVKISINLF